jgi:hypothetical protein
MFDVVSARRASVQYRSCIVRVALKSRAVNATTVPNGRNVAPSIVRGSVPLT